MLEHLIISALLSSPAASPIFTADFSSKDPIARFDHTHHANNASIVADPTDQSNPVLRINVNKDDFYGGAYSIRLANHLEDEPTTLYFRYRLWIDESWTTTIGGKLPGFGGTYNNAGWGGKPSNGSNGWSARGLYQSIDQDGNIPIGSYIYHADMVANGQTYGNSEPWGIALKHNRWYTIEQEIQLNTVKRSSEDGMGDGVRSDEAGLEDGSLKAWVDGELVYDRKELHLRDTDTLRIETVWFNIYHGGKTPSPKDMHLLIDDIIIAHKRPIPEQADEHHFSKSTPVTE
jgi:Polysaccharide lyase 14